MKTTLTVDDYEDGCITVVDDGPRCTGVTIVAEDQFGEGFSVVISKRLALSLALGTQKMLKGQGYRAEREGITTEHEVVITSTLIP